MHGTHSSGSAVAITEDTAARVALLRTLELGTPANEVRAHNVVFAPDGQTLAVTLREHVQLWRVADGQRLHGMDPGPVFVDEFMGTAWTPDGRLLASINTGAPELVLWRADNGKVVNPRATPTDLEGMLVSGLAMAPDGTLIATSGGAASIRLWGVL